MHYGRHLRDEWLLDREVIYLNHPTVGATPRRVLAVQRAIQDEIERQPSRFMLRELTAVVVGQPTGAQPRLRRAADAVAAFVKAQGGDLVFVENTTSGINAVLRSFPFKPGDEILLSDLTYGAIRNVADFVARERAAAVRIVTLPWPPAEQSIVDAFDAAVTARTRVAIVDHIAAEAALVLPVGEIATRLKQRGVAVLVDGAHAPGAIELNIPSLGVDWYVANLHKWALVPRSSGVLWAAPDRQRTLHPAVISWGLDQGFTTEFDLVGTRDPSAHLAAPAALELFNEWGGPAIWAHNHHLVIDAARALAQRWSTSWDVPESLVGPMATVTLPEAVGATREAAQVLRDRLLFEERIEVQVHASRERLHVRVSAQIYNDMADFERLGDAVDRIVRRSRS
jgi:isopenicillin-N epimerase